jgi:hypothetical protein
VKDIMNLKRRAHLVALLLFPVAAVGAALTVIPGASAQTNSRVCGNYWLADAKAPSKSAPDRMMHAFYAKAMEVNKGDFLSCDRVKHKTDHNDVATDFPDWASYSWSDRKNITLMSCEEFSKNVLLGTKGQDECQEMNKANSTTEVDSQNSHLYRDFYYFCPGKTYNATNDTCA